VRWLIPDNRRKLTGRRSGRAGIVMQSRGNDMASLAIGPLGLVTRLFRWWVGELAGLVPSWLQRRLAGTTDRVVLLPGDGEAALYLESSQELTLLGRVALDAEGDAVRRVGAILGRHSLDRAIAAGRATLCLRIPAERALRTTMDLPLAAEKNLDEVVSFELDRHTPFRAEQVFLAPRIIERNPATQRLTVDVLLVPRSGAEEAMAVAARLHLEPSRIDIAEEGGQHAASDNLLRAGGRRSGRRGYTRLVYGLAATAAILAVIAVALPIVKAQQAADELAQQFALVKQTAVEDAALQKQVDELRKNELFLIQKKRERPTVSTLLLETTRILPDNTWLSDWQLAGSEVQLLGVTESASAIVGLLEQSRIFEHTTFLSPVTQDSAGHEHFHVSTQVVNGDKS